MSDPMPTWFDALETARLRHRRDPTARYAQLATCDAAGRPRCRTVVVRRCAPEAGHLDIVTDARSAKMQTLADAPWAELCWYFAKTREQFRLLGELAALGDAERRALWSAMSEAGRRSFAWPAPGAPLSDKESFEVAPPVEAPTSFVVLRLTIVEVDHLDLRPDPHRRARYVLERGGWSGGLVNP